MRIVVDYDQCESNAICMQIAPDVFEVRDDDFLYTLFVPARAHRAFPCFDQPDLKGRYTLSLDVPAGWQAIANGAVTRSPFGRIRLTPVASRATVLPRCITAA